MDKSINAIEILELHDFSLGRMISHSKSAYLDRFPNNKVYFNANIFVGGKKIWWGDLDLTRESERLQKVAEKIGKIYILREMDGRFDNEELIQKEIEKKAVWTSM